MILSNEEACFYLLLLKNGYKKEVDEWIDNIAYNNETLEGIYLELVYNQSKINDLMSCLHNYIKYDEINDESICIKLRLFIKQKLDNNEITIEKAIDSLYGFLIKIDKISNEYWNDFYLIGIYSDYVDSSLLDKYEFYALVKAYLNSGNKFGYEDFWKQRKLKYEKNKLIKEDKEKLKEKNKQKINYLRNQYNIPNNILTTEEYVSRNIFLNYKWVFMGICEIICLAITMGFPFYFDNLGSELATATLLFGLAIAIYGFCILCDAPIKGLIYSFAPVLCYAIPLMIIYYILQIRTEWLIGLLTILFGSLFFILFFVKYAIKSYKNHNKILSEYLSIITSKYKNIYHYRDYYTTKNYITLWKINGTHVTIFEYDKDKASITITGNVKYKNELLKEVIIDYTEVNDTFYNCVINGINILNSKINK